MSIYTYLNTATLLETLLPPAGSLERVRFDRATEIVPVLHFAAGVLNAERKRQATRLGILFLQVADEAVCLYAKSEFKGFDAIVRNYGCQITALEVSELANLDPPRKQALLAEAVRVQIRVRALLAKCRENLEASVNSQGVRSVSGYLRDKLEADFRISRPMARLIRLRLLGLTNSVDEKDRPLTNCSILYNKVAGIDPSKKILETLVCGVQADESREAASYIRRKAAVLPQGSTERGSFLFRVVSSRFEGLATASAKKTPIVSVPLTYNAEIVLRSISTPILVKNKLQIGGKPIAGAVPIQLLLRNPDTLMTQAEVDALDPRTPLVVIEGYVRDREALIDAISRVGLVCILQANCFLEQEYASGTPPSVHERLEADEEVIKDKTTIRAKVQEALGKDPQQISDTIFKCDHLYGASLEEEIPA